MSAITIPMQQRRDLAATWTTKDPVLLAGQMGVETDTLRFKIGDGTTAWNSLAYTAPPLAGQDQTVTAAGAFAVAARNSTVYVNPAAALATLVPAMPTADLSDGDIVRFVFGGSISIGQPVVTAVTWPTTVLSALPASLASGDCVRLRWADAISKWVSE